MASAVALVALVVSCTVSSKAPKNDAFVGLTVEQVIERLGRPDDRFDGNFGLPDADWAREFEPCETFTYQNWNGTLYLSVHVRHGTKVCFSSAWLPRGGVF